MDELRGQLPLKPKMSLLTRIRTEIEFGKVNEWACNTLEAALDARKAKGSDVDKVKAEVAVLDIQYDTIQRELTSKRLLLRQMESDQAKAQLEAITKRQEEAKLAETCIACEQTIVGDKQKVPFGPFAGRYLCGSTTKSACYNKIASKNLSWLVAKRPAPTKVQHD